MLYKLFIIWLFFAGTTLHAESGQVVTPISNIEPVFLKDDKDDLADSSIKINDPFIIAAASGDITVVQQFLNNGTSINYAEPVLGLTALIVAISASNEEMVLFLLQQPGIDVNKAMNDRLTPLHCAVLQNDAKMVKLLVNTLKIDYSAVEQNGLTAKAIACMSDYTECSKLFESR